MADALALVRSWHAQGDPPCDPVQFAVLSGLARRAEASRGAIRQALLDRLATRLAALPATGENDCTTAASVAAGSMHPETASPVSPVTSVPGPVSPAATATRPRRLSPASGALADLAALTDRLGREPLSAAVSNSPMQVPGTSTPAAAAAAGALPAAQAPRGLRTATRFAATWSRLRAERRLRQALAQVPATAGPLNSAHLINQALHMMRAASPAYFDAFTAHVDTLLHLERMTRLPTAPPRVASRPVAPAPTAKAAATSPRSRGAGRRRTAKP